MLIRIENHIPDPSFEKMPGCVVNLNLSVRNMADASFQIDRGFKLRLGTSGYE